MERCIDSLLHAGSLAEIILINDGSKDNTGTICDRYADKYPELIKVVHQSNGGHGEGINQGLRYAKGFFFKVVDSDDWVDVYAVKKLMEFLEAFAEKNDTIDMLICNYVYERALEKRSRPMRYVNVFPQDRVFGWNEINRFNVSQYLLMHSVIYRTDVLRECGIELPKHAFYVDNLFVYKPLPSVRNLYYLNIDLYRYLIGRKNQSVNENVMVSSVDQQIKITKLMIESHDLFQIRKQEPKLAKYMTNYMSMMMMISSILLLLDNAKENKRKQRQLWAHLKKISPHLYNQMRLSPLSCVTVLPELISKHIILFVYRLARKKYGFS